MVLGAAVEVAVSVYLPTDEVHEDRNLRSESPQDDIRPERRFAGHAG